MTVWFDAEPLLVQSDNNPRPTGIGRVSLELFAAAEKGFSSTGEAGFFRMSFYTGRPQPVDYADIERAYAKGNAAIRRLSPVYRHAMPMVRDLMSAAIGNPRMPRMNRGDVVICLGDFWFNKRYARHVRRLKAAYGVRFGLLIHDLAPIAIPDQFPPSDVAKFRALIAEMLDLSDIVFVCSNFSKQVLDDFARENLCKHPPLERLNFGAGFHPASSDKNAGAVEWPERFVLYVSTVEGRKNHLLLLRIWKRLMSKHGAATPDLVFVGQKMWRSEEVTHAIHASDALRKKVIVRSSTSDADLACAYRRCLFTVYPSHYEGWGLPVAESLKHGKHCVASNATSIPEVGGDFVEYFSPDDDDTAFEKIERVIFDLDYRRAKEDNIARNYVPPSWDDCMRILMSRAAAA